MYLEGAKFFKYFGTAMTLTAAGKSINLFSTLIFVNIYRFKRQS